MMQHDGANVSISGQAMHIARAWSTRRECARIWTYTMYTYACSHMANVQTAWAELLLCPASPVSWVNSYTAKGWADSNATSQHLYVLGRVAVGDMVGAVRRV